MPAQAILNAIEKNSEESLELARHEVAELKKALQTVERFLRGQRKAPPAAELHDLMHSSFEVFRCISAVSANEKLLADMQEQADVLRDTDFLERHGAQLLKKPAGWHWINPKGEMIGLSEDGDPVKAAAKLRRMQTAKARARRKES